MIEVRIQSNSLTGELYSYADLNLHLILGVSIKTKNGRTRAVKMEC